MIKIKKERKKQQQKKVVFAFCYIIWWDLGWKNKAKLLEDDVQRDGRTVRVS